MVDVFFRGYGAWWSTEYIGLDIEPEQVTESYEAAGVFKLTGHDAMAYRHCKELVGINKLLSSRHPDSELLRALAMPEIVDRHAFLGFDSTVEEKYYYFSISTTHTLLIAAPHAEAKPQKNDISKSLDANDQNKEACDFATKKTIEADGEEAMSLREKYKTDLFPYQYYETELAPCVLMRIKPHSKFAKLIVGFYDCCCFEDGVMECFDKEVMRNNSFVDDWHIYMDVGSDDLTFEVINNQTEFFEIVNEYHRIRDELFHSDVVLKWGDNKHVPLDKLIEYGNSKNNANALIHVVSVEKKEPSHDKSSQLRALNQASQLWINADRDDKTTWTDTNTVVNFLIGKGFSKTLAKRGASIVRPDWAESGARPKE